MGVRFASTDHYGNLNLTPRAGVREIKHNFKKLSMQLHPDILLSQELSQEDLHKKKDHYLQIKKSYELLMDPEKKAEYDRKIAVRTASRSREGASRNFHYAKSRYTRVNYESPTGFSYGDPSHFDSRKHMERNLRNEQRVRDRRVTQFGDLFRHNIASRNISMGIHKDLHDFRNMDDDVEREKKLLIGLFAGFVAFMMLWQMALGRAGGGGSGGSTAKTATASHLQEYETAYNNDYSAMLIDNAVKGSGHQ